MFRIVCAFIEYSFHVACNTLKNCVTSKVNARYKSPTDTASKSSWRKEAARVLKKKLVEDYESQ